MNKTTMNSSVENQSRYLSGRTIDPNNAWRLANLHAEYSLTWAILRPAQKVLVAASPRTGGWNPRRHLGESSGPGRAVGARCASARPYRK